MTRSAAKQHLKKVFQLDSFYDEQSIAIEKILKGERVLLIEKPGFLRPCWYFLLTNSINSRDIEVKRKLYKFRSGFYL